LPPLYLRVSSEEQRDRETIEIQREFLEQYRSLYELEVTDVYEDDGISGTIPLHERLEGRRLLEDAREGKFGAVLVYRLDRLGRSLLVIVDAHDRLQEAGVALRSGTEPIDTSNLSGRLIFQMLASFAEYDRESIRERTHAGRIRAWSRGKQMGAIPYGYNIAEGGPFVVVENEARVVREIFENIAAGATLYSEAKRLNDEGVPSPGQRFKNKPRKHGSIWRHTTVGDIIRQLTYTGSHVVKVDGGAGSIEREVPALVDSALRQKALSLLEENKRYAGGHPHRNYLLSGLIECAHCGRVYGGISVLSSGKRYQYYACGRRRASYDKQVEHPRPYVSAQWLENLIWQDVRGFLKNPGEVLERLSEQLEGGGQANELEERRESLEKRLASKQAERDRAMRLYMRGLISEEEAEVLLADLKNQADNVRLLIESVETDLSRKHENMTVAKSTQAWLLTLRERIVEIEENTEEAFKKRRDLVKLLVEKITVDRSEDRQTEVQIIYRFGPPPEESAIFVDGVQSLRMGRRSQQRS
jgi:site-specific DNA recombinase